MPTAILLPYNKAEYLKMRFGQMLFGIRRRYFNKRHRHNAELLWRSCGRFMKGLTQDFDVAVAYQQGVPTYLVSTKISAKKKLNMPHVASMRSKASLSSISYSFFFNLFLSHKITKIFLFYQRFRRFKKNFYICSVFRKKHKIFCSISVRTTTSNEIKEHNYHHRVTLNTRRRLLHW